MNNDLIGVSKAMMEVCRFIEKVAPTDSTVLIQGESGTGKELVAQALHRKSARCNGPFVAVNCAALQESLLESELFGYERGAFTGALTEKKGKFQLAEKGTLFLDEVGELSPSNQAKLLRPLQEREIDRIGGKQPVPVDIRVIAATNRDLDDASFRQDLYSRLSSPWQKYSQRRKVAIKSFETDSNFGSSGLLPRAVSVVSVRTPALRERRDDIPVLALHFTLRYAKESGRAVRGISPEAESVLVNHDWPGNVRDLQNVIKRAIVLGSSDVVGLEDLPRSLFTAPAKRPGARAHDVRQVLFEIKRQLFETALERTAGDYEQAAILLGMHPKGMHRALKTLKLSHLLR